MICITGDMHGDISRLKHKNIRKLKKNDYLIVCGDFGFVWDGSRKEKRLLKQLGKLKYHVLFVEGCHENYDLLSQYEVTDWKGGKARAITGKLIQLMRGNVYKLGDRKIFTFGGGQSDDIDIRREAETWWPQENPAPEEIDLAIRNLQANGNVVDYIITHEPPFSIKDFLQLDTERKNEMTAYFDIVKSTCRFKSWFFGKYHINKTISQQYHAVFDDVVVID